MSQVKHHAIIMIIVIAIDAFIRKYKLNIPNPKHKTSPNVNCFEWFHKAFHLSEAFQMNEIKLVFPLDLY